MNKEKNIVQITRSRYKEIKKMDHNSMERVMEHYYRQGYTDGRNTIKEDIESDMPVADEAMFPIISRLPCKMGDIVFDLVLCDDSQYRIFEMRVCNINYFGGVHKGKAWNVYLEDEYSKAYRSFYDFGKIVFLTQEQAELALQRIKERKEILIDLKKWNGLDKNTY